ncbi:MAG: DUF4317 domain-containing protein [Clostridia bacterium]|nr:DUF4317 domain-containing protein [Clostridia bacterium]
MTQKDLGQIKKRLNPQKRNALMLRGCYVDPNGNVLTTFKQSVGLVPQEDLEKFILLFRKALSGTQGQNLHPITFSNDQVESDEAYGLLSALNQTELEDDAVAEKLFNSVIDSIREENRALAQSVDEQLNSYNHLILLLSDRFDAAYRHGDDPDDPEMRENTFRYVVCAVCPVVQGKEQLRYDAQEGRFHTFRPEWQVSAPEVGFMFPSFEQGSANIYQAMYYTKDQSDTHEEFLKRIFHADVIMPAQEQRESVANIIQTALQEECSMEVVQAVNEKVSELIQEQKEDKQAEPLQFTGKDVRRVLESAGVSEEKLQKVEDGMQQVFGESAEIPAVNMVPTREFKVKTPNVQIRVAPDHADLVTTKVIDGVKYIMILADGDVEVNGVNIAIT